jgi:Aspartyl protease
VFIKAEIGGKLVSCMLDTGCERSVIGRNVVLNLELTDTNITLFAANGTEIPLSGALKLSFTIGNLRVWASLVVTEALEELKLGFNWLSFNNCQWDFI